MYPSATQAVNALRLQGKQFWLTSQNLVEFWAVATRPTERNGLGFTPEQAETEIIRLQVLFPLLPDDLAVYVEWKRLVAAHRVVGLRVYDTRLVAAMHVHGLTHILTFNVEDFRRYDGVTVVHPQELLPAEG